MQKLFDFGWFGVDFKEKCVKQVEAGSFHEAGRV